ncbi:MAG: HD-GYP domain-containing protein [Aminipila sp.]
MRKISLDEIKIGMCVGQDLHTENGQLITPSNTIVTPTLIKKLKRFKIETIEIVSESKTDPPISEDIFNVKDTESFKQFKSKCTEAKQSLTNSFDSILESKPNISHLSIIKGLSSVLYENNKNNLNLMDMIYNIHEHSDLVYTHSINVGMIAGQLGRWLGFSEADVQLLTTCGLFHDIGKLLIPREIVEKPGKLTDVEYKIIQTHTIKGYELLEQFDSLDDRIKKVALFHHERCDGTGYPMNFNCEQLDSFSKIIAIADTYEAMTSERSYRSPICPFTVATYFEEEGLKKYEPKYVLKFIDKMLVSYLHSKVVLNTNQLATVIMINKSQKSKPLVALEDGSFIDLAKNLNLSIVRMIS